MLDLDRAGRDEEAALRTLELLSTKVRGAVPPDCCEHDETPCLSCALKWFVEHGIGLNLVPVEEWEWEEELACLSE